MISVNKINENYVNQLISGHFQIFFEEQTCKGTCPKCHKRVANATRHLWEAHRIGKEPKHHCPKCGKSVGRKETLTRGLHSCRSEFQFPCSICDTRFLNEKKLRNHIKGGRCKSAICPNCLRKVTSEHNKYRAHITTCKEKEEQGWRVKTCNESAGGEVSGVSI